MIRVRSLLVALAAATLLAPIAHAQGPFGGGQITPEMRNRMQAWRKWRDSHKNISALQQTLGGLAAMEQDPRTRLTKPQAKKVVGILKAWRNKPVMTDAQALQVNKQLTASLSIAQLKKIATARAGGRGGQRRGGPGGGGGGQARAGGGQGRQGGGRMDANRFPAPRDYNPLNPSTLPFERMRGRAKQSLDSLTQTLAVRAR